jgi:hypothetical protein
MNAVTSFRYCTSDYLVESGEALGMPGQGSFSILESRQPAVQYPVQDSKTEMLN